MTTSESTSKPTTESRLAPVHSRGDILASYRGTPVETLLARHALGEPVPRASDPQMVVVTCMDHRIDLRLPEAFAFVIRTAGATVEPVVFNAAVAVALRDINTIAIIGHSDCAMVNVEQHRDAFVEKVSTVGAVSEAEADAMFVAGVDGFGCADAVVHTLAQSAQVRAVFPEALVAPLFYDVRDGSLSQIIES